MTTPAFNNELGCFYNMTVPQEFFTCFATASGDPIWNLIYLGIVILAVGGWSFFRPINEGLMIGGFLTSLVGLGFVAMSLITVKMFMVALLLTVTGVIITVIKRNSNS